MKTLMLRAAFVALFPALVSCQMNQYAATSELAKNVVAYLQNLTTDANGGPNARVACTDGYDHSASFVADEMERLGLEKFGDANQTTYFNLVPESVHEEFCPFGLRNVIGLVRGTELPDEYVVYSAHLDGPNNFNIETQPTIGNADTTNVYDNGLAVALGLEFAKKLAANPPRRSVLFIFDDAEEGWISIGTPEVGTNILHSCWYTGQCTDEEREFYNRVKQATCPASLCDTDLFDFEGTFNYQGYPIGLNSWTKNPTVDLGNVRLALFGESLGPPPGANIFIAIRGNNASYGSEGTMNNFLDTVLPSNLTFILVKTPTIPLPNYGSADSFTQYYEGLCGGNCIESGGIPSMQFTTLSQQRYHGGALSRWNELRDLFRALTAEYPDLKSTLNGKFPSPAYYSFDNMASMDWERLDDLAYTMELMLVNSANSDTIGELQYLREPVEFDPSITGPENMMNMAESIDEMMNLTSDAFQNVMSPIIEDIATRYTHAESDFLELGTLDYYMSSLFTLLDFFNEKYVTKIAFSDENQMFGETAPEEETPEAGTPPEKREVTSNAYTYATSVVVTGAMACSLILL